MRSRKIFYKYQSLKIETDDESKVKEDENGNPINYTIKNLENNQLYFGYPPEFNDPFDCKMYDEKVSSPYRILFELKNVPRVCCFSQRCDNILMWSHYADYHKGICLCFRAAKNFDSYCIPLRIPDSETSMNYALTGVFEKVKYDNGLIPKFNKFDDSSKNYEIMLERVLTKFKVWRYEKEYRIIHPNHREYSASTQESPETLEYYKESLKGVIFGCRIKKNDAQNVYSAINKNNQNEDSNKTVIKYYEAIDSLDKCELRFQPIDDMDKFIDSL